MNIVGCGRAARTIAAIWQRAGVVETSAILNRSLRSAEAAARFVGAGEGVSTMAQMPRADLWMIGVGDDQIETVSAALADSGRLRRGDIVFHLSGAYASDRLARCHAVGAHCASIHAIHSFADPQRSLEKLAGSYCVVEGEGAALATLAPLIDALETNRLEIDPARKIVYHAGMVLASNFVVALLDDALAVLAAADVPPAEAARMLAPLVLGSVENVLSAGADAALTGPVARGDAELVAEQLAALEQALPAAAVRYRALALAASAIARRSHAADPAALDRIDALLRGNDN